MTKPRKKSGIPVMPGAPDAEIAFEDLQKYAQDKLGVTLDPNITRSASAQVLMKIITEMEIVFAEFPILRGFVKLVDDNEHRGPEEAFMSADASGAIHINGACSDYFKSLEAFTKTVWGRFPNERPFSAVSHELGHELLAVYIRRNAGLQFSDRFGGYSQQEWDALPLVKRLAINQAANDWSDSNAKNSWRYSSAYRIVENAADMVRQDSRYSGKTTLDLVAGISNYATTNPSEAIAEALSAYMTNHKNADVMSIAIFNELKRVFRK